MKLPHDSIAGTLLSGIVLTLVLWLVAWAVQVWGHKVEGKKPSFTDDLVFLLVGPVFVSLELAYKLGLSRTPGHGRPS